MQAGIITVGGLVYSYKLHVGFDIANFLRNMKTTTAFSFYESFKVTFIKDCLLTYHTILQNELYDTFQAETAKIYCCVLGVFVCCQLL